MGESKGGAAPLLLPQELLLWPGELGCSRGTAGSAVTSSARCLLWGEECCEKGQVVSAPVQLSAT